jgi:hypothetical protein
VVKLRTSITFLTVLLCIGAAAEEAPKTEEPPSTVLLKAIKAEAASLEKDASDDQAKAAIAKLQAAFDAFSTKPTDDQFAFKLDEVSAGIGERKNSGKLKVAVAALETALVKFKGDPDAAELKSLAGRLGDGLAGIADDAEINATIDALVAQLAVYQGKGGLTFLQKQAGLFAVWLNETPGSLATKVSDITKVLELPANITKKFRQTQPLETAKSLDVALRAVVTREEGQYAPPLENPEFAKVISELSTALKGAVSNKYPIVRFNAAADEIIEVVGEPAGNASAKDKKTVETNREWLQNNPDSLAKAEAAIAALKKLEGGFRPQVHIIEATYGDTGGKWSGSRYCDATLAMREKCERQAKCELPASYQTALCGFDPIPRADDRIRGVAVQFACFAGGDPLWDSLARAPTISPTDGGDLSDLDHFESHLVILRGAGMTIRCPFEGSGLVVTK